MNTAVLVSTNDNAAAALVMGVTEIAKAFLATNPISPEDLPGFLRSITQELSQAASAVPSTLPAPSSEGIAEDIASVQVASPVDPRWANLSRVPVIPVEDSVTEDAIVCLFDGVPKKMLKRYIRAKYGMEEADYKAWFGLPADYPMVAPGYAAQKAAVAIEQGLGSTIDKTPRHLRLIETQSAAA